MLHVTDFSNHLFTRTQILESPPNQNLVKNVNKVDKEAPDTQGQGTTHQRGDWQKYGSNDWLTGLSINTLVQLFFRIDWSGDWSCNNFKDFTELQFI